MAVRKAGMIGEKQLKNKSIKKGSREGNRRAGRKKWKISVEQLKEYLL